MPMPRWKRLTTLLGLSAALLSAALPAAAQDLSLDAMRQRALDLVNQSRRAEKLPPMTLESKLNAAAQAHAADMLKRNYYAHSSPEGKSVSDRFQKAGGSRWLLTAENIAKCDQCRPPVTDADLKRLQEGWMNSPGHRANILRKGLTTFGYGIVADNKGGLYAVQNFAGPGTSEDPAGKADSGKALSADQQGQLALEAINRERKKAGRGEVALSQGLSAAARALAPPSAVADFGSKKFPDLYSLIPEAERNAWSELSMVAAICGGCGLAPAAADVSRFAAQWFADARYSKMLLDPALSHVGFTVSANGEGKKVGLGLLGKGS